MKKEHKHQIKQPEVSPITEARMKSFVGRFVKVSIEGAVSLRGTGQLCQRDDGTYYINAIDDHGSIEISFSRDTVKGFSIGDFDAPTLSLE